MNCFKWITHILLFLAVGEAYGICPQGAAALEKVLQAKMSSNDAGQIRLLDKVIQKMDDGVDLRLNSSGDLVFPNGNLALSKSALETDGAVKIVPSSNVDKIRRALSMTPDESKYISSIDPATMKRVKSQRFGRSVVCGKTKKPIKTFRREGSRGAATRLSKPSGYHTHNSVPDSITLDRHLNGQSQSDYMGLATTMSPSNTLAGNSGGFLTALCVPTGSLICLIGGAESELVLMNANWKVCK